jgi:hypothetical protein
MEKVEKMRNGDKRNFKGSVVSRGRREGQRGRGSSCTRRKGRDLHEKDEIEDHQQEKYLLQITKAFKRRRNQHQENGEA